MRVIPASATIHYSGTEGAGCSSPLTERGERQARALAEPWVQLHDAFDDIVHVRRSEIVQARATDDGTARVEFRSRDGSRLYADVANLQTVVG